MATVQIADIYNPLVFAGLEQQAQIEMNAFIQSGVLMPNPVIQNSLSPGGHIGELTNYQPLGTDEPNYSTDVEATLSVAKKITKDVQKFRSAVRNQSWSAMDIAKELALQDPVMAITNRQGRYWATDIEKRLIYSCRGVLADNITNDSSDMVNNIYSDIVTPLAANKISADAVIDAQQTMGDKQGSLGAIAMHSIIFKTIKKQNLIAYIPNARGEVVIPTYLGLRVIVDDSLTASTGFTNTPYYDTIIFGQDVFGSASGRVENPSEFFRNPSAGNGGGQSLLWSRRNDVIHPIGFSFTGTPTISTGATYAELATGANWNRIFLRKNIKIAFLRSNA